MSDNEKSSQQSTQWANLLTDLFDRLTGKGAEISYNFERLEIDIQRLQDHKVRNWVALNG